MREIERAYSPPDPTEVEARIRALEVGTGAAAPVGAGLVVTHNFEPSSGGYVTIRAFGSYAKIGGDAFRFASATDLNALLAGLYGPPGVDFAYVGRPVCRPVIVRARREDLRGGAVWSIGAKWRDAGSEFLLEAEAVICEQALEFLAALGFRPKAKAITEKYRRRHMITVVNGVAEVVADAYPGAPPIYEIEVKRGGSDVLTNVAGLLGLSEFGVRGAGEVYLREYGVLPNGASLTFDSTACITPVARGHDLLLRRFAAQLALIADSRRLLVAGRPRSPSPPGRSRDLARDRDRDRDRDRGRGRGPRRGRGRGPRRERDHSLSRERTQG